MKATDLYNHLEKDFYRQGMSDNWFNYMGALEAYLCDNFKQRSIGVMCDFALEVNKVYTAVFPSDNVLTKVLDEGTSDAMLFLHHASSWDLGKTPGQAFHQMNPKLLDQLKERRISLFCFHAPLDAFGEYSTGKTLADALDIKIEKLFCEYSGSLIGAIGTTNCKDVHELSNQYSHAVGHETKLYHYGDAAIANGQVAVVAGGGCDAPIIRELVGSGVSNFITGLTAITDYSKEAHELAKANNINLLGGTHYSSEKFACIAMCGYFSKLRLASEFISDIPCLHDL
ncbi:MAG: Nif3-like dinuclear metal center hexameric protein [Defluviitaleaceae bacterium]|nr:Nif3-like dinuclear metal center hexameric protein [Defluviitaleaceae bacterium]